MSLQLNKSRRIVQTRKSRVLKKGEKSKKLSFGRLMILQIVVTTQMTQF